MKFTFKIIISILAIISVIFSIAGIVIIKSNFEYSFEKIKKQNIDSHILERYGVKNNIDNNVTENGEISKSKLVDYIRNLVAYLENNKQMSIYMENENLYSNIEIDKESLEFLSNSEKMKYTITDIDNIKYMLISSKFEINNHEIIIISRYDITDTFEERDRQLNYFYKIDIIVILTSTIFIGILSIFLTKPIIKLNEASKKIAKGDYGERIKINSKDEIGELAKSFNIMIETIENKIKELELSVKQKEEFITNFTHELKNPMTAIIGYAELLKSGKYDNDTNLKSANYIYNEAKRLEILAHKLMDLMKLTNENVEFEKINIADFMNKLYKDIKENLGDVKLELDVEEKYIIADKILLEDALRNLIDNSKKANPKDNMIKILGKKEEKDKYKISVIDNGCGIPKNEIPRIKESFYIIDKARAREGGRNGIGLSICEKIAKIHNSELEIESEEGKWTRVSLYLEVIESEE